MQLIQPKLVNRQQQPPSTTDQALSPPSGKSSGLGASDLRGSVSEPCSISDRGTKYSSREALKSGESGIDVSKNHAQKVAFVCRIQKYHLGVSEDLLDVHGLDAECEPISDQCENNSQTPFCFNILYLD